MSSLNDIVIGTLAQIAQETINADELYQITDYPVGGITNAQMAAALTPTYNAFFQTGEVFICSDTGTYTKGAAYKFTGTSWELVKDYASVSDVNALKCVNGTATLLAASWVGTDYTLTIAELGANDSITFAPLAADKAAADAAGLWANPVTSGTSCYFTATNAPAVDIELAYTITRG